MYSEPKKMAPLLQTTGATEPSHDHTDSCKWMRVLRRLLTGSLNRFEAESLHDHCLNSTIPKIEDRGIRVSRSWETVPCMGGRNTARVLRYTVERDGENMARAQALLGCQAGGC